MKRFPLLISLFLMITVIHGVILAQTAATPAASPAAPTRKITVEVRVPKDSGDVFISGNIAQLGPWAPGKQKMEGEGNERTITLDLPEDTNFEFKITRGTWETEAVDLAGSLLPNHRHVVHKDSTVSVTVHNWRDWFVRDNPDATTTRGGGLKPGVTGNAREFTNIRSKFLRMPRNVTVWFPPGYQQSGPRRYPVLYVLDGQHLFDPSKSYTGIDWGIDEAMTELIEAGEIDPWIVVGVWYTNARMEEYTPWEQGDDFAKFMIQELKPLIDEAFPTHRDAKSTALMGASLAGIQTLYMGWKHSDVYGRVACLSTHFPAGDGQLQRDIEMSGRFPADLRLWMDHGTIGRDSQYGPWQRRMNTTLEGMGRRQGQGFEVRVFENMDHTERSWRARMPLVLPWLLARDN